MIKNLLDAFETASKKTTQKPAEGPRNLIGNKIADRITIFLKTLPQNNSKIIANEFDK